MFRKTTGQMSFLDVENVLLNILPQEDWSFIYKNIIYQLIDEDKFKNLYVEDNSKGGRPNKSVKTLVSILIFMSIEKLTWREAEYQFSRRLDWLLVTNTDLYEGSIDHTTLFKFYCRLEGNEKAKKLFEELTTRFIKECETIFEKQRTDSFFIHGWLQILSRYGLFKETSRVFLQNLRKHKPGLYEEIKEELSRDYLGNEFDLTEKDREKAQRQIKLMAKDMYELYKAFIDHNQVNHYESFKTLTTVFDQ